MTTTSTITSQQYLQSVSKDSNVLSALSNFQLWLNWYPNDYAGATEFAGDMIETLTEANKLEAYLHEWLILKSTETVCTTTEQGEV